MKTTTNNNGTNNLQTINLEENVKFSEIPAIYNFEKFSIFVESKQTGKTHGEKTLYYGTITNNGNNAIIEMQGYDITKIKKIVNCNFKRVYISNMDGCTVPKCKELTAEMIDSMVLSLSQRMEKQYNTLLQTMLQGKTDGAQFAESTHNFISAYNIAKSEVICNYRKELEKEQLKISIENKEKENKKLVKQYQKEMLEAIQSMDFEKMQDLANKIKDLEK
jgi:hypothetical protein